MELQERLKKTLRPALCLRLMMENNVLKSENEELKEQIKGKLWEDYIRWQNEPSENTRLRKENKRLRQQVKSLKEIIKEDNDATTNKKKR